MVPGLRSQDLIMEIPRKIFTQLGQHALTGPLKFEGGYVTFPTFCLGEARWIGRESAVTRPTGLRKRPSVLNLYFIHVSLSLGRAVASGVAKAFNRHRPRYGHGGIKVVTVLRHPAASRLHGPWLDACKTDDRRSGRHVR